MAVDAVITVVTGVTVVTNKLVAIINFFQEKKLFYKTKQKSLKKKFHQQISFTCTLFSPKNIFHQKFFS